MAAGRADHDRLSRTPAAIAHAAAPLQRGVAHHFAADRRACGLDCAGGGGSAGATCRRAGRCRTADRRRRPVGARARCANARRGRHARQRVQSDDGQDRGAEPRTRHRERPARKSSGTDRGGDGGRFGGRPRDRCRRHRPDREPVGDRPAGCGRARRTSAGRYRARTSPIRHERLARGDRPGAARGGDAHAGGQDRAHRHRPDPDV